MSLSPNILFLFQTSIKATHWKITPPHFNNNTKGQGLANLSRNSPPPNISERQASYPPNTKGKFEQ